MRLEQKHLTWTLAIIMIVGLWLALNQKLLFGEAWLSETYDNVDWRTNEGDLHTYGAWDLEAHIWKSEYISENYPHFHWNPYWYLGMPLLKYYQSGFYVLNLLTAYLGGINIARAALLLVIFGHLIAVLLTFLVAYKVSGKVWASALSSVFLLTNTFLTLRSYGWEPITVVFLFLFPLGVYFFLRDPLKPFRLSLALILGGAYLAHPLIWFSLLLTMGIYLLAAALRSSGNPNYLWQYMGLFVISILLGAVQFLPQVSYEQVTSGAHMGVKYLPYYQVPFNIISFKDFMLDAGNLKGPGPIVMIASLLLVSFAWIEYKKGRIKSLLGNAIVSGLAMVLFVMVLLYYLELYNIFPMNFLRSIQYHRIIPEFVIVGAVLVAALANLASTYRQKIFYYSLLIGFVAASSIIIYNVQDRWATTEDISSKPEFLAEDIEGRITFPYTDQSLSVRNSFTKKPQAYGYYEQGITNPYLDEIFSVSSGFHSAPLALTYLKAANIGRLYINTEEGERDKIVFSRMNGTLEFADTGSRYSYFKIPLHDASYAEAVDTNKAATLTPPGCREIYREIYCGSIREEFVTNDLSEIEYLNSYTALLEEPYHSEAGFEMLTPDNYNIVVKNASSSTGVVIKMTFDKDFKAIVEGKEVPIEPIGPWFMLIKPQKAGNYEIKLEYVINPLVKAGAAISIITLLGVLGFFARRKFFFPHIVFREGDMA